MCVVCGTDYTPPAPTAAPAAAPAAAAAVSPDFAFKAITTYKSLDPAETQKHHDSGGGFYDWYSENYTDRGGANNSAITYITNESMFDVMTPTGGSSIESKYKQLVILNSDDIHKKRIVEIMTKEDFIFIEPSPSPSINPPQDN